MSSAATSGAKAAQTSVEIGKKTYQATSRLGKAFAKVANFGTKVVNKLKSTKIVKVITQVQDKYGKVFGVLNKARKVGKEYYDALVEFEDTYSRDFLRQTSADINEQINDSFNDNFAVYVKKACTCPSLDHMPHPRRGQDRRTALCMCAWLCVCARGVAVLARGGGGETRQTHDFLCYEWMD